MGQANGSELIAPSGTADFRSSAAADPVIRSEHAFVTEIVTEGRLFSPPAAPFSTRSTTPSTHTSLGGRLGKNDSPSSMLNGYPGAMCVRDAFWRKEFLPDGCPPGKRTKTGVLGASFV